MTKLVSVFVLGYKTSIARKWESKPSKLPESMIANRIAWLIQQGCQISHIYEIRFTAHLSLFCRLNYYSGVKAKRSSTAKVKFFRLA